MTHTSTEQENKEALDVASFLSKYADAPSCQATYHLKRLVARVQELEAAQAQRAPLSDSALLARIRKEIDHAIINDHRTVPAFGKRIGEHCVKVGHLEATIDGWALEHGITQEKQG